MRYLIKPTEFGHSFYVQFYYKDVKYEFISDCVEEFAGKIILNDSKVLIDNLKFSHLSDIESNMPGIWILQCCQAATKTLQDFINYIEQCSQYRYKDTSHDIICIVTNTPTRPIFKCKSDVEDYVRGLHAYFLAKEQDEKFVEQQQKPSN